MYYCLLIKQRNKCDEDSGIKMVVGEGFEPTNAEAGGFTVRIL